MSAWAGLLVESRRASGLSQDEMARASGTSRPTLSAYEHGRKVPGADTLERLLGAVGVRLVGVPVVTWRQEPVGGGRSCWIPDRLWRLPIADALAQVVPPVELNWSVPGLRFALRDRRQRSRLYELLLREAEPADLERWVDGTLLLDAWDELVLPRRVRERWQTVVDGVMAGDKLGAAS